MIGKKFRLKTREVKKVLHKGKPFFSYTLVIHTFPNTLGYVRSAIVLGGKSVENNVIRNMFRRHFYDTISSLDLHVSYDLVCVVKSKTKLEKTPEQFHGFCSEISYLCTKKIGKNT